MDNTALYLTTGGAVIAGALLTLVLQRLFCRRRSSARGLQNVPLPARRATTADSSRASHIEPLLLNGRLHIHEATSAAAAALAGKSAITDLVLPVKRHWLNLIFLVLFSSLSLGVIGSSCWALVHYFDAIWRSGFVAALLLGGIAFALRYAALWVYQNVLVRHFCTTMVLSRARDARQGSRRRRRRRRSTHSR